MGTFLLSLLLFWPFASGIESFGARGDGKTDDAPAFNRCIHSGEKVVLKRGHTYMLKSALDPIASDRFVLEGNGATILIASSYPLDRYANIFRFEGDAPRSAFEMRNVRIVSSLGQKFQDRMAIGDSYVVFVENARKVTLSGIDFEDRGKWNNISFFVSNGCDLEMSNCSIRSASMSKQGGAVWVMDRNRKSCRLDFRNVIFDYDDCDESVCIGVHPEMRMPEAVLDARFSNCVITSRCCSQSSGYVIAYNHSPHCSARVNLVYEGCSFVADGPNARKIQSYQLDGGDPSVKSVFRTEFNDCSFDFRLTSGEGADNGLLGLLPMDCVSAGAADNGYVLRCCSFKMRGISPVIGDADGGRKGYYHLASCTIDSDGRAFTRRYNPGAGDLSITLDDCSVISADESVSTESVTATRSTFTNIHGRHVSARKLGERANVPVCRLDACTLGGKHVAKVEGTDSPLSVRTVIADDASSLSDLCNGDLVYADPACGRDVYVYFKAPKTKQGGVCVVNGHQFKMDYLSGEGSYFCNVRMTGDVYGKGANSVSVDGCSIVFTIE